MGARNDAPLHEFELPSRGFTLPRERPARRSAPITIAMSPWRSRDGKDQFREPDLARNPDWGRKLGYARDRICRGDTARHRDDAQDPRRTGDAQSATCSAAVFGPRGDVTLPALLCARLTTRRTIMLGRWRAPRRWRRSPLAFHPDQYRRAGELLLGEGHGIPCVISYARGPTAGYRPREPGTGQARRFDRHKRVGRRTLTYQLRASLTSRRLAKGCRLDASGGAAQGQRSRKSHAELDNINQDRRGSYAATRRAVRGVLRTLPQIKWADAR